jgi:hypothetical protein
MMRHTELGRSGGGGPLVNTAGRNGSVTVGRDYCTEKSCGLLETMNGAQGRQYALNIRARRTKC